MKELRDKLNPETVQGLNNLIQKLRSEDRDRKVASLVEELDRIAALGRSALVGGYGGITLPSRRRSTRVIRNGNH